MIFKWLFGETKPAEFDQNKIPKGDLKYTLTDAKRHLKEHLTDIRYGDSDDIKHEMMVFSEYVSYFKDNIKDELDGLKEDLKHEKECLRDAKTELSAFRKTKTQYVRDNCIDDYAAEVSDFQDMVEEHEGYVNESVLFIESQKLIYKKLSQPTKFLLPRFIKALGEGGEPSYDHFDPPIRIWIRFKSQRVSSSQDGVTERLVDVRELSASGFSGHCLLRNDRRTFSYAGILMYKDENNSTHEVSLFDYLLSQIS